MLLAEKQRGEAASLISGECMKMRPPAGMETKTLVVRAIFALVIVLIPVVGGEVELYHHQHTPIIALSAVVGLNPVPCKSQKWGTLQNSTS